MNFLLLRLVLLLLPYNHCYLFNEKKSKPVLCTTTSSFTSLRIRHNYYVSFTQNENTTKPETTLTTTISTSTSTTSTSTSTSTTTSTSTSTPTSTPTLNQQVIVLSPGGIDGFYMLGICKFIKDHYNLSNYVFSGASAGAWNSLFMAMKETNRNGKSNTELFLYHAFQIYDQCHSFHEYQLALKEIILKTFTNEDFDFQRIFIGVTHFEKLFQRKTVIYSNFLSLSDCLDCCISSSHIPLLTSRNFFHLYQNKLAFDGGFSTYPYIDTINPVLYITPTFFEEIATNCISEQQIKYYELLHKYTFQPVSSFKKIKKSKSILQTNQQFFGRISSYHNWNPFQLFSNGYLDTEIKAIDYLQRIFCKKEK